MGRHTVGAFAAIFIAGCGLFPSLDDLTAGEADAQGDSNSNLDSACCDVSDAGVDASDAKQTFDASPKDAKADTIPQGSTICGNTTVNDCAFCPNAHQTCVTCDSSGTKSPPFCVPTGDTCRNEPPSGYSTFTNGCECSEGGVATCPLADQVCHSGSFCHTCGEPLSTGEVCKGGGTCDGSTCQ